MKILLISGGNHPFEKTTPILEKLFFTSDVTAFHDLHHSHPYYPYRKLREIFKKNQMHLNKDENVYTTSRLNFLKDFYRSLS